MTKVILATNIAETSLTLPDVVYVVDGGQVNMASFDPVNNMPRLGPEVSTTCRHWLTSVALSAT
jgi:HrpA-like RNA helicase